MLKNMGSNESGAKSYCKNRLTLKSLLREPNIKYTLKC